VIAPIRPRVKVDGSGMTVGVRAISTDCGPEAFIVNATARSVVSPAKMPGGPLNVMSVVFGKGGVKVTPFEKVPLLKLAPLNNEPAGRLTATA
jgi:hypothetical protein